MNVVHIITGLGQGGAESMLEKLICASIQHTPDVQHAVVSLQDAGVIGPRLAARGIPITALHLGGPLATARGLLRLVGVLRRMPRDTVVQTWLYHADLIGGCAARLCGLRRLFWNLRGVGRRGDLNPLTYLLVRISARLSSWLPLRIVACGPAVLESHVTLGYARASMVVIGNGFDFDRFRADPDRRAAARHALGIGPQQIVIGTVARLHLLKGYPTLAEAAARTVASMPQLRFLWIGEGVDTDPGLSASLERLGLQQHVRRLGLRRDIPDLLRAIDVYCLPSRSEGFPNVLGEAMACALPCVSTDAGDASYLLGAKDWIVPVEAPERLAEALLRMCRQAPEVRQSLGRDNLHRVTHEFSIEAAWRRYLAMYTDAPC